ncbi:MAG: hypothetical protein H5T97_00535 [Firmicutes bacterium]|nr:hypothetical protein [Bacillota bacterium]
MICFDDNPRIEYLVEGVAELTRLRVEGRASDAERLCAELAPVLARFAGITEEEAMDCLRRGEDDLYRLLYDT